MILTTCAACAAPLAHNAPRCVRCKLRYCDSTCQHDHWRRGHKQMCKKIHRGGNAEQYNADKKYKEAVAVAVEACAKDTKGQTCYICTQALHWKTKEGLVRMCACRGTAGFAHVSCLAEQAKILCDEAEDHNLFGTQKFDRTWDRWHTCSLCEQSYYGVVCHALGWACWKTYVGRPEADQMRCSAMRNLANGLYAARNYEDALSVEEGQVSTLRRLGAPENVMLDAQSNLALTYRTVGRHEAALGMLRDVYSGTLELFGEDDSRTLFAASNYAASLNDHNSYKELKPMLRKTIPVARRVLGENYEITLKMRKIYARSLYGDPSATLDDLREAVTTLEELERIARRVLGGAHPLTVFIQGDLQDVRATLAARETPSASK